ncbi:hypothetical protein BDN67DRAFT_206708 [Paxillus ammoniavirescens]|nr:hypothetical protein BDN67DRAFT_206708 [Paxillus ammoniavirescens]
MTTAAGLSRRRVATASSSSVTGDDTSSPGWHSNGSASNGPVATHAGSAFEGGNKIAFDPRDLDQDKEDSRHGGRMPRLTIMEEVLLLGLKDKHVCHHNLVSLTLPGVFSAVPRLFCVFRSIRAQPLYNLGS